MEVIVALTIFLISMAAIGMLIDMATQRSADARSQTLAMQLCQAKLAEFAAGVQEMGSQNGVAFDFDPNWTWSANCTSRSDPANLWTVEITVERKAGGFSTSATLSQMILDPSIRGTTEGSSATAPAKTKTATTGKKGG